MSKKTVEELQKERAVVVETYSDAQAKLRELDYLIQVENAKALGLPKKEGWYLDSNGLIARLEDGIWHDGWGNSGPDYDFFSPPMTRLVPEKKTKKKENN